MASNTWIRFPQRKGPAPAASLSSPRNTRGEQRTRLAVIACCGAIALAAETASGADLSWPMFQANAAHNGYVPVSLNASALSFRWQKSIHVGIPLNPVTAAEGKVFVSDSTGLCALNATNGNLVWNISFPGVFSVNPPSYGYGNVYIQTCNNGSDTYLHAYTAATGAPVFNSPHAAQWEHYYAPTLYDGKVYVDGGEYGGMYGFDAYSGTQLWFSSLNQYDQWTPAVDAKYAYAYTGEYAPNLSVVDRLTGTLAFSIPDPGFQWDGWSMNLAPVLGSVNDVLAIHNGRLIFFDLATHGIRWQIQSQFQGQPSVAGGVIYALNGGVLEALDESTGNLLWSWSAPFIGLSGTMIVTDSHVLARSGFAVYAVNLQTHAADWSYPVTGHLALADGVLYVADDYGFLTAFTAPSIAPPANQPPVCRIGGPYTAECNGAATTVQLDGSGSSDPDGDALAFQWTSDCPGATFDNPAGPTPVLTLDSSAAQFCTVTLVVSDGQLTATNQTTVTVVDTTPPEFSQLSAVPAVLWPPNHKMIPVTVAGTASDACDPAPVYRVVSVVSSDPVPGPGNWRQPDFQITGPHTVLLRAERANPRAGRQYWLVVEAKDASGNTATNTVVVTVPGPGR